MTHIFTTLRIQIERLFLIPRFFLFICIGLFLFALLIFKLYLTSLHNDWRFENLDRWCRFLFSFWLLRNNAIWRISFIFIEFISQSRITRSWFLFVALFGRIFKRYLFRRSFYKIFFVVAGQFETSRVKLANTFLNLRFNRLKGFLLLDQRFLLLTKFGTTCISYMRHYVLKTISWIIVQFWWQVWLYRFKKCYIAINFGFSSRRFLFLFLFSLVFLPFYMISIRSKWNTHRTVVSNLIFIFNVFLDIFLQLLRRLNLTGLLFNAKWARVSIPKRGKFKLTPIFIFNLILNALMLTCYISVEI